MGYNTTKLEKDLSPNSSLDYNKSIHPMNTDHNHTNSDLHRYHRNSHSHDNFDENDECD